MQLSNNYRNKFLKSSVNTKKKKIYCNKVVQREKKIIVTICNILKYNNYKG